MSRTSVLRAWRWVPTAYFAEGAPFMTVSAVTAILFKSIGMDNTRMAFWTSLMMLPWTIKPLWAPLLDLFGTKRRWIIGCQLGMGAVFLCCALLMGSERLTFLLIGLFFLLAFASATHDIAADGFYLIALDSHGQSFFAGIRSTAYRIATVCVQGGLVALAGAAAAGGHTLRQGWQFSLGIAALAMGALGLWHIFTLPRTEGTAEKKAGIRELFAVFRESLTGFVHLPGFGELLLFLLFFRMAEAMLGKISGVFLIDRPEAGGLGLTLGNQGFLYGTIGVLALTVGGILGGLWVARTGFRRSAWFLAAALNLPDLVYVYLAWAKPASLWITGICIAAEQFGYGLGYTAFMMVMLAYAARSGRFRTSHFAFMTAISILSLTLCGMISGALQQTLGYLCFFWLVILLTSVSFLVLHLALQKIPQEFGLVSKS